MNLLEAIRRDQPNTIRVGTQNGGHFIYIGRALSLIWYDSKEVRELNKKTKEQCEKYQQTIEEKRRERKQKGIERELGPTDLEYRFVPWQPVLDREVVDAINSTCDSDRIYIVTGCESLIEYKGNTYVDAIQIETARKMVEWIYQGEVQNLLRLYKRLDTAKTIQDKLRAALDVMNAEAWFRKDHYGILSNPEGFIAEIRKQYEIKKREEGRR